MPTTRTKNFHVYLPDGGPVRLEADLEEVYVLEGGKRLAPKEERRSVGAELGAIRDRSLPGGPRIVATFADLEGLFAALGAGLAEHAAAAVLEEKRAQKAAADAHAARIGAARAELEKKGTP